ncbi:MAG: hypothetical protein HRT57_10215 [Crocinitomicaceae bacterium]|nr:hypothetical protein [Crocinitomicaceae bacterium]
MNFDINKLSDYLSQIVNQGIKLNIDDLDGVASDHDKEIAYGLICISDDMAYYRVHYCQSEIGAL